MPPQKLCRSANITLRGAPGRFRSGLVPWADTMQQATQGSGARIPVRPGITSRMAAMKARSRAGWWRAGG